MATLTYSGCLTVTECWCGIKHAIPAELYDHQLRQHRDGRPQVSIYCPLGHIHVFAGEALADRLKRERNAASDRAAARAAERDQAEASARAYKGAATKARKRAAAALCPVPGCGRSFVQLRRHMAAKHPGYGPAKSA